MDPIVTLAEAHSIARQISALYGVPYSEERWVGGQITVVEGSHEEADCEWILSWEEGPDGWVHSEKVGEIVTKTVRGAFTFADAINHYCIGFYE